MAISNPIIPTSNEDAESATTYSEAEEKEALGLFSLLPEKVRAIVQNHCIEQKMEEIESAIRTAEHKHMTQLLKKVHEEADKENQSLRATLVLAGANKLPGKALQQQTTISELRTEISQKNAE